METKGKIASSAKLVENEKSAKQREELEQAEAKAKAARQAAIDAREEHAAADKNTGAKTTAAKAKRKSGKKKIDDNGILEDVFGDKATKAGKVLAKQLVKEAMKKKNKNTSLVVLGFIAIIVIAAGVLIGPKIKDMLDPPPPVTVIDELTDAEKSEILKNKQIEIQKIVLNESVQRKELLVLEQDIQVESVFESALAGLDIFKKAKKIISYGTGYFNVNLASLTEDKISVDHDKKIVTVTVPHAYLKSISVDEGKTQYEDTQKGLLSFGELKLTMEQQGLLKKSVEDSMREELIKPEMLEEADRVGKVMIAQIYQPFVSVISDEYYVQVEIAGGEPAS